MTCPFLRKMNVKYCGLCRRTMIPLGGAELAREQCAGPGYGSCAVAREHHPDRLGEDRCPSLCVCDVHYCELAPVRKLIPCNRTAMSRCTDDGHRHCQLYLSMTDPRTDGPDDAPRGGGDDGDTVLPPGLSVAPNHMWLDRGDGRTCHVGVDAFLTRALGRVDEVVYPLRRQGGRPAVRLRVRGVDLDLVFPHVLAEAEINAHLVVDPRELLRDPYGRGWIFEGVAAPGPARGDHPLERGLRRGEAARAWLRAEHDRLDAFAHAHAARPAAGTGVLMQDGGRCRGGLADLVGRRALVRLHDEFFTLRDGRDAP